MRDRIFVTPAPGVSLKTANGTPVPPEGEVYKISSWWKRRERDGDAIISQPKTKSAKVKGSDK